jgi:hypothetical protein
MKTTTGTYENTHGRKPRGYGLWALNVTGTDGQGSYTTETYFITGKLTDVSRQAVRRLKSDVSAVRTVTEIEILP